MSAARGWRGDEPAARSHGNLATIHQAPLDPRTGRELVEKAVLWALGGDGPSDLDALRNSALPTTVYGWDANRAQAMALVMSLVTLCAGFILAAFMHAVRILP